MRKWFKRMAPDQDRVMASRWLRPVAPRLAHPGIWHFNRRSVARGVALGLFAAFLLPIGQIFLAALMATSARSNVLVAAGATLITNPLTFPPIYYAAWRTGQFMVGSGGTAVPAHPGAGAVPGLMDGMLDASLPLVVGLVTFAVVSAALGYAGVHLAWRIALGLQWRRRRLGRG